MGAGLQPTDLGRPACMVSVVGTPEIRGSHCVLEGAK
jgi:hypothetical protein